MDGEQVKITGYEVIVTKEVPDDPHGFSRPTYDVHVPARVNSLSVPAEFLEPDTVYELEVWPSRRAETRPSASASSRPHNTTLPQNAVARRTGAATSPATLEHRSPPPRVASGERKGRCSARSNSAVVRRIAPTVAPSSARSSGRKL